VSGISFQGTVIPAVCSGWKRSGLLGKHPAGDGVLEGGRSSLLESAQQATLSSVATLAFPRQLNELAVPHCNRIFTLAKAGSNGLANRPNAEKFSQRRGSGAT
jgi:hypothetical protein